MEKFKPIFANLHGKYVTALLIVILFLGEASTEHCQCARPCPRDCSDLPATSRSGTFLINPGMDDKVPAYCNMETAGGGWVTMLHRYDGHHRPRINFDVNWDQYKWGIGTFSNEFWWGLEHVWKLTSHLDRKYELRVDMYDYYNRHRYAIYQDFKVTSEADGYRLRVGNYSGNAGDALSAHQAPFSTKDRVSKESGRNCANRYHGGWWFKNCYKAFFTGLFKNSFEDNKFRSGSAHNSNNGKMILKRVDMLIRPMTKIGIGESKF